MIGGLTWATLLGAAAVDSINPCTIAILVILLTTLLTRGQAKKILWSGLGFSGAIYLSYFFMGLGFYSALQASGITQAFYYIVIGIAFLVGILSIKSYFSYKPGFFAVEMPLWLRPYAKKFLSSVVSVPGAIVIGFLCSLFLLPCSSGPYLVILGLLAKASTRAAAIPLLLIYNLVFILPMVMITLLVYLGKAKVEHIAEWKENNIQRIHLISGIIMIALAVLLFLAMRFGWV